jgi:Rrf2 family protein
MREFGTDAILGVHAMHLLVQKGRAVSLRELRRSGGFPLASARTVLHRLQEAGLVASRPRRGYVLSRAAGEITLLDILRAVQQPEAPRAPCGGDFENCDSRASCVLSPVCRAAQQGFEESLRSFTLAELAKAPLGLPNCADPRVRPEAG